MPAFADITNKAIHAGALPHASKKPASLACVANGNLRSRRAAPVKDKTDDCMQDASSIMSIASAGKEGCADTSMVSATARGDTTVSMRSPTKFDGPGGDPEFKSEGSAGYTEMLLEETTFQLIDELKSVLKSHSCANTKELITTVIGLDSAGDEMDYQGIECLEYRDTSTRNISRVLGRGAFKIVLEDEGKALAVFIKNNDEDHTTRKELLILQEIMTSVLLSSHRRTVPNFLLVDGVFRTKTCRRFVPEDNVAFRMELCNINLNDVLTDGSTSRGSDGTAGPRLSLKQIDGYFFQLCSALAYMHSVLDIYHLDLKPLNILLTSLYDMKSGFGSELSTFRYQLGTKQFSMSLPRPISLVKIADLGSSMPHVSSYLHTTSGTLSYRPPEFFFQGPHGPAGACTDVFAVGLMMLEAYLGMGHDEFIEREIFFSDELAEDFLYDHIDTYRLCRLVYGYFVLFSTRTDIELYRRTDTMEDGWPINAGDLMTTFVSMLVEDAKFLEDWRVYSIQSGSAEAIVQLRSRLCGDGYSKGCHPRVDAFLSMLRIDPEKRATAAALAMSPLFDHMAVVGYGGKVVCHLVSEEIFA